MLAEAALSAALYRGVTVLQTGLKPVNGILSVEPRYGLRRHLSFHEQAAGSTLVRFDDDMTKKQHMVVVSDDLQYFAHVHPTLHTNGTFTIDYTFPKAGFYHIYMDGIPNAWGRQVFRFDVPIDSRAIEAQRIAHRTAGSVDVGPYRVTLDQTLVPVDQVTLISVRITKGGRDATDLHPYLGTNAHGLIVGLDDLAYVHAHAMGSDMIAMANAADCGDSIMQTMMPLPDSANVPARMQFYVLLPHPQRYDLWLQFRGGTTRYTAPLLLTAR